MGRLVASRRNPATKVFHTPFMRNKPLYGPVATPRNPATYFGMARICRYDAPPRPEGRVTYLLLPRWRLGACERVSHHPTEAGDKRPLYHRAPASPSRQTDGLAAGEGKIDHVQIRDAR